MAPSSTVPTSLADLRALAPTDVAAARELAVREAALAERDQHIGDIVQADINAVLADKGPGEALDTILGRAAEAHAAYPQYDEKWTRKQGWQLGVAVSDYTTKGGLAFREGDVVAFTDERERFTPRVHRTVYSALRGCVVALDYPSRVKEVAV